VIGIFASVKSQIAMQFNFPPRIFALGGISRKEHLLAAGLNRRSD
jgi:hypothetical protein